MRVLFVVNSLIYGGAETQLIAICRELARRGHGVAIHTLRPENPRAEELSGSGVELVPGEKRCKIDPGLLMRLRGFNQTFQADVVQGFLYDGDLYARLAFAGTGIPVLMSERNDNYQFTSLQRIGLLFARSLASGLVANSHAGAHFARKHTRLPDTNIHVVWNGLDLDAIDKPGGMPGPDPRTVHFSDPTIRLACLVGMVRPEKDYHLAIRVAAALVQQHPAWRILFVGDCLPQTAGYKAEVLAAFRQSGLEGRAVFAGLCKNVVEIIRGCDVLFSTSLHEGFPNVVLEAMAAGTPVVSTAYSDIRLILPEPWQVVSNRKPEAIAQAIVRADQARATLVPAQRAWVEANATIGRTVDALLDVYQRYVDTERPIAKERSA